MGASDPSGLVLVLGGVGGLDLCGFGLSLAVRSAGLPYAIERVVWGHGFGRWYSDLSDVEHLSQQADRVAGRIRCFRAEHPGEPVFLVGKSGGAGLVLLALERLEPGSVERAVLLAPAVSPRYDLTAALRAVRGEMTVFTSPLDVVILGAGTRLFGTIDRVRTFGAGLRGFDVPEGGAGPSVREGPAGPVAAGDGRARSSGRPLRHRSAAVPPRLGGAAAPPGRAGGRGVPNRGPGSSRPPSPPIS